VAARIISVAPAWHTHVQAVVVGVQHAVDRAQILKGPVMHGCYSRPRSDAYADRAFAVEFTVRAPADLPEAIDAAGYDVVVGPAQ
jgi:hypothetical protein